MSPKVKYWLEVAAVAISAAMILSWLTSCAGVPYMRASVTPDGTVVSEKVTPHEIPPTGIVLWSSVEAADGSEWTEVPDGPLPIPGLPWWAQIAAALAIRAVATKSGRANLKVLAGSGQNVMARGSALIASTGVWSSPPEAIVARAKVEPKVEAIADTAMPAA